MKLGMTKAQVVALLGKPLFENAHGYMQYSKSNLFDVYLNPATKRVRLIGISGPNFCTVNGVCMMKKGGLAKIKAQYGAALRKAVAEDGDRLIAQDLLDAFRRVVRALDALLDGVADADLFHGVAPGLKPLAASRMTVIALR